MKGILSGIVLFLSFTVYSQGNKFQLSIGGGASVPVGIFGKPITISPIPSNKEASPNYGAGYAVAGYYSEINTAFYFSKILGLSAEFNYLNNGVDQKSVENISTNNNDGMRHNNPSAKTNWINYGAFLGLTGRIIDGDKLGVQIGFACGLNAVVQPRVEFTYDNGWVAVLQDNVQHNNIAFKGDVSLNYYLSKLFFICGQFDYLFVPADSYTGSFGKTILNYRSQEVGVILTGIKAGIRF